MRYFPVFWPSKLNEGRLYGYDMQNKLHLYTLTALLVSVLTSAWGQDTNLANQYFINGEYAKAATIYDQLLQQDDRNEYFFNRYIDCLMYLEDYDTGEKAVKKRLKKEPRNYALYVTYGGLLERAGRMPDAEQQYDEAIRNMPADFNSVNRLANLFTGKARYDYATKTYETGAKMLKDPNRFAFNLGELYRRKGDTNKMMEQYLNSVASDPGKTGTIQTLLSRYLSPADYPELQAQLYARIQKEDNPDFIELLAWSFVQNKDFASALRQYKALDRRYNENGQRVFELAQSAADAGDYDSAISAYDYVVGLRDVNSEMFYEAMEGSLDCRRRKITEGYAYTVEELQALEQDYLRFLNEYPRNQNTTSLVLQLAQLEALYLNNTDKAISLLNEQLQVPGQSQDELARIKIDLADYYLIQGEIWESTLLYSQVDKDFKEETIGQEARFKNARLSYFNGDFEWAQSQCNILKAATSRLIANDALDLSVFIMDNLNLDTTSEAVTLYSSAEMLVYQNQFDQALLKLDTLARLFPEHSLKDDILYLQAQIAEKRRQYPEAARFYQAIVEKYPEDIRADNALFALAGLYENRLNDAEKAKELYEKVFIDYSGSVFAVEARKRYRILRGDTVQ